MQYKQVPRIVLEIFDIPDTPVEIRLSTMRLATSENFPKLGSYRKRSPEQALWRTDNHRGPSYPTKQTP